MKVLIIDNYDSFTFNLYQYIGELLESEKGKGERVKASGVIEVVRNDEITIEAIEKRNYDRIILSPGPGDPKDKLYFGVCADILTTIKTVPILGVCLGMQGMAHYFGGKVVKAKVPMHGKTSKITHTGKGIFAGLPQEIEVMRYHSLVADAKTLPECLEVIAVVQNANRLLSTVYSNSAVVGSLKTVDKRIEVMGLRHKTLPIVGVQFHPESFATEGGKQILANFLFKTL